MNIKTFLIIPIFFLLTFSITNAEITRSVRLGSSGPDVLELQKFLNKDIDTRISSSGAGSPGLETTYFGRLTDLAVRRLQIKYAYEVLTPAGLSGPTGVVGPFTRALIYRLSQTFNLSSNIPDTYIPRTASSPTVSSISPSIVTRSPQTVTIKGSNFTLYNNTVVISSESQTGITGLSSSDGKTISFPFIFSGSEKIKSQLAPYYGSNSYDDIKNAFLSNLVSSGHVIIVIKNANGESAPQTLNISLVDIL